MTGRLKRRSLRRIDSSEALSVFGAFAHPTRLEIYRLLVRYLPYGLAAGDIARLIAIPHNTLSSHLAILEQAGLLRSRREGRSIIFAAVEARAQEIATFLTEDYALDHGQQSPILRPSFAFPAKREVLAAEKTFNVLVLCTGNSARSIFAEAILSREGAGRFRPFSAGSHPEAHPNQLAITLLSELGYDVTGCRSKSWHEFAGSDGPAMDFILTVCDVAAGETCPAWPGHPLVVHWGIPDPIEIAGSEAEKRAAFVDAYRRLTARITSFVNLDVENLDRTTLKHKLITIGGMEGATELTLKRMTA
jgi:ArsR family transcriptional regulator, arsenate/arsenite/antimonite-responsive transcriptional repressor / arsenate reductase (thioredoxin)